jgi:hypothetical protein
LLEAEKVMIAARNIGNRWYSQVAGIALIAFGIAGLSLPAPTSALHRLEDKAVQQLAPVVAKSEIGRQILAVYVARDVECHRSL